MGKMHMHRMMRLGVPALLLLLFTPLVSADKKKGEDTNVRTVRGTVTDAQENTVDGAIVQIKNTRTLAVRSFITKDHGTYAFFGLSPDVDYELRARFENHSSAAKTLSSFDNRKQAIINLKLDK